MENKSSDKGMQFSLGKTNTETIKENVSKTETPTSKTEDTIVETRVVENDDYVDNRYVTIKLVKNYSLYRRVNDKTLPKRNDAIGSSINSSLTLSSNKGEVEYYFPNIVGLSPSNDSFITRVKQYWNNIHIPVNELGRKFDISFHFNHKSDYVDFNIKEQAIEDKYMNSDRSTIKNLKKALEEKIKALNALESTKYLYGHPLNVEDYLMYRHCLLYSPIAKDIALINSDSSIKFYFEDDKKEAEKVKKHRNDINKAKVNFVSCLADTELFNAIYVQYCVLNNLPVLPSLMEDEITRENKLDRFSQEEPVKFNKFFANKDSKLIATIEILIARGELVRPAYSQNITTVDGDFIGANMNEAVAWFKNPNNNSIATSYINKLKNI